MAYPGGQKISRQKPIKVPDMQGIPQNPQILSNGTLVYELLYTDGNYVWETAMTYMKIKVNGKQVAIQLDTGGYSEVVIPPADAQKAGITSGIAQIQIGNEPPFNWTVDTTGTGGNRATIGLQAMLQRYNIYYTRIGGIRCMLIPHHLSVKAVPQWMRIPVTLY